MNHSLIILIALGCMLSFPSLAFASAENCDSIDFCSVVNDVETNYVGFPTMVNNHNRSSYEEMKRRLYHSVIHGEREGCDAASEYVAWFRDHHLFTPLSYQYFPTSDYSSIEYAPQFVSARVNDETYLLRIPTFDWDSANVERIKAGVSEYLASTCDNLIIDLRGNSGGADWPFYPLVEIVYSHPFTMDGIEVRSTPDIADYLRKTYSTLGGHRSWTNEVCDSIDTGKYEFVTVPGLENEVVLDSIYPYPRRVALIIDGNTASSAEQFIIFCRQCSDRVTIYGKDNTMGAIDFGNLRRFDMPCAKLSVQVPMSRSKRLARGEIIDGVGITPDVHIDLPLPSKLKDNIDEWILHVAERMK